MPEHIARRGVQAKAWVPSGCTISWNDSACNQEEVRRVSMHSAVEREEPLQEAALAREGHTD